jgi:hypothetical protein
MMSTVGSTLVSRIEIHPIVAIHAQVIVRVEGRVTARHHAAMLRTASVIERPSLRMSVFHIELRGSIATAARKMTATTATTRERRSSSTKRHSKMNAPAYASACPTTMSVELRPNNHRKRG